LKIIFKINYPPAGGFRQLLKSHSDVMQRTPPKSRLF